MCISNSNRTQAFFANYPQTVSKETTGLHSFLFHLPKITVLQYLLSNDQKPLFHIYSPASSCVRVNLYPLPQSWQDEFHIIYYLCTYFETFALGTYIFRNACLFGELTPLLLLWNTPVFTYGHCFFFSLLFLILIYSLQFFYA